MASLAAGPAGDGPRATLTTLLQRWERRQRWQRTWMGLPRSLLPGLALGLALLLWSRLRFGTPAEGFLPAMALLAGSGLMLLLARIWLPPRPTLALARKFERDFGLSERLSTALELMEGRIHSSAELTPLQIADAGNRARDVDVTRQMPLRSDRRAWATLALLLLAIGLVTRLPAPSVPTDEQEEAQEAAIDEAAAAVERISEEVASDTALPAELRQQLQRELERSQALLGQEALSPEEAFAALSESAEQFEQQALALEESIRQQMQALANAQQAGGEQLEAALRQLENAGSLPPGDDVAGRLEQAAASLEASNPELAQAIREALQALRDSQLQNASNAAGLARQILAQQQQQLARAQDSQQRLRAASDQLRDSASQIAQRSQAQPLVSQERMQQQPGSGAQPQAGDMSMQGQPQESGAGQRGENPEAGSLPGSNTQAGEGEDVQAGSQGGQPGGQQTGQGQNTSEQDRPGLGGQAGDAPGGAGMEESFAGVQGAPPGQGNNPDGLGQREFAPVYAPRRLGASQGPELYLENDPGDSPLMEGDFAPNPSGEALVPWNEIYGDYLDAASRALESDYIPLGLRDVVHDYFSALEPGR
ncbi:MAG: hypothetical protein OXP68_13065 [Anaerolineaceae bacterium]|nr:hypothetical protein [Anaerolineaceae bacterium]MDE0328945.1 hypothetical protein [Anaerolineaceae bacterium]